MNGQHSIHYFNLKSELHELYFSISLRTFAIMLINIFVPIYLIKLGYTFQTVLWFFTIFAFTHAVTSFPAAKISSNIGLKHTILISVPFLILYYFLLYSVQFVQSLGIPIITIAVFGGVSNALFWIGHHTHFAEYSHEGKIGKELGTVKILISIFTAIGPVIGGLLLTFFSFNVVFLIVCGLLVLSVIPLLMSEDKHEAFRFSLEDFRNIFKTRDIIGNAGCGIEGSIQQIIWPVFIFFFILDQEFTTLGTISSLSLLFSLIITYMIANNVDKKPNFMNDIGAIINSCVWILKTFVRTSFQVLMIDSVSGMSRTTQNISFNKICYDKAKKTSTLQYIVLREFNINFAHAITYFFLSFVIAGAGSYFIAFLLGTIGSLMFLFYRA
ncbi:MFS transporter [Candidatus Woesearchaeota archaeon]|nr:MFS transporter [Candidatus Woesearchaeota archaeon]